VAYVRSEVYTEVKIWIVVFWDMALHSLVLVNNTSEEIFTSSFDYFYSEGRVCSYIYI
jgi:hypothetical protein